MECTAQLIFKKDLLNRMYKKKSESKEGGEKKRLLAAVTFVSFWSYIMHGLA